MWYNYPAVFNLSEAFGTIDYDILLDNNVIGSERHGALVVPLLSPWLVSVVVSEGKIKSEVPQQWAIALLTFLPLLFKI